MIVGLGLFCFGYKGLGEKIDMPILENQGPGVKTGSSVQTKLHGGIMVV